MKKTLYIGAKCVPSFYIGSGGSSEWVSGVPFEPLTVVTYNTTWFISKKPVPAGAAAPQAGEYWAQVPGYITELDADLIEWIQEHIGDLEDAVGDLDDLETTAKTNLVAAVNELNGETSELKDDLSVFETVSTTLVSGLIAPSTGELVQSDTGTPNTTDFIPVTYGTKVNATINLSSAHYRFIAIYGYKADKTCVGALATVEGGNYTKYEATCTISNANVAYVRVTFRTYSDVTSTLFQTSSNVSEALKDVDEKIVNAKTVMISKIDLRYLHYVVGKNLFDKSGVYTDIVTGYYRNYSTGNWSALATMEVATFKVEPSTAYSVTHINLNICFFSDDDATTYISGFLANSTNGYTFITPATAKTMCISIPIASADTFQVEKGSVSTAYQAFKMGLDEDDVFNNSITKAKLKKIIVDKAGNGDYTSLTEAMRENPTGYDFYVRPGVYDLIAEMQSKYGATYFDDLTVADHDDGLEIQDGTRVFLDAKAIVKFEYTGSNTAVSNYFSPFKFSGTGGELHGGQIICSNCRYAIHDDCYTTDYDNRITDGVYIYYRSSRDVAIGGGLGKSSHVELKNCYVDSGSSGWGVFYHNNSEDNTAQNFVSIHDNYFTRSIIIEPFGPSELMSRALVSNNKASAVTKRIVSAEENPSQIDNFDMIAWNNVTA